MRSPLRRALGLWGLLSPWAMAQITPEFPYGNLFIQQSSSPFTIEGAGARAMGLGGAFTAVADDATAVSFNPAGLAQLLRPEVSFSLQASRQSLSFGGSRRLDGSPAPEVEDQYQAKRSYEPKLLALTAPFQWGGRNLVLQASMQRILSFKESGRRHLLERNPDDDDIPIDHRITDREYTQGGQVDLASLALAYEVTQRLLVGAAYNLWRGRWDLDTRSTIVERRRYDGEPFDVELDWRFAQQNDFKGANWTLGLLWRWPSFRLGASWRTTFMADYAWSIQTETNEIRHEDNLAAKGRVRWPATAALGAAWKPHAQWQVAFDWNRTPWTQTKIEGTGWWFLEGANLLDPRKENLIRDVVQLHAGIEYLHLTPKGRLLPVRVGWFREPQPLRDTLTGVPRTFTGWTLGTGFKGRNLGLDVAYRFARSRREASRGLDYRDIRLYREIRSTGQETLDTHRVDVSLLVQYGSRPSADAFLKPLSDFLRWVFVGN